ncbi:MAG TPA: TolC family protein, partial [Ramlibacter sp.]|nr:TolC family protein [Ramlibacter sp.]
SEMATTGARFSAPGFGQSTGVNFDTSVTGGTSTRYGVEIRQPLYSAERSAQGQQLNAAADAAAAAWQGSQQDLMVRAAQRYFDAALAEQQLRLLGQQEAAAEHARVEAEDRFRLGDRPVTDVHEAAARASALKAQRLTAANDLQFKRVLLADLTGTAEAGPLVVPAATPAMGPLGRLEDWLERAAHDNPQVRAAQAQLRSAEDEARKTAALVSPTLDLIARAGRDRLSGSGDFGAASNTSTQRALGVELNVPLYTGGWRSARHDETTALVAKARSELERARLLATQGTRAAWLDLSAGQERIGALEAGLKASRARLEATKLGLEVGDRTTLDVLNAENDAAAAELALVQARIALITQRLSLAASAGSLDETELTAANRALLASP